MNKCCKMPRGTHRYTCSNNPKRQAAMKNQRRQDDIRRRKALRLERAAQHASEDADVEMFGSYNPDLGDVGCK